MTKNAKNKSMGFELLGEAFHDTVMPTLETIGFEQAKFSANHFGSDGRDKFFEFWSLPEDRTLEILRFFFIKANLGVTVNFNQFSLPPIVNGLHGLVGKSDLKLRLKPYSETEMQVIRMVPIPFLHIAKPYKIKRTSSPGIIEEEVAQVIANLDNDILNVDIIRSEWSDKYSPVEVKAEHLEG